MKQVTFMIFGPVIARYSLWPNTIRLNDGEAYKIRNISNNDYFFYSELKYERVENKNEDKNEDKNVSSMNIISWRPIEVIHYENFDW